MKLFFKTLLMFFISFTSVFSVAVAAETAGKNTQSEQVLKKQALDLKRARLRESLKQDQAHSLQRRAIEKQKKMAETDRAEYYKVLRRRADPRSLLDDENVDALESEQTVVLDDQNEVDERTRKFHEWVNSNMMLNSDSQISHKDAMKFEQEEELKKNLLDGDSETVIVKKKSIGKIERVRKEK